MEGYLSASHFHKVPDAPKVWIITKLLPTYTYIKGKMATFKGKWLGKYFLHGASGVHLSFRNQFGGLSERESCRIIQYLGWGALKKTAMFPKKGTTPFFLY